MEFGQDVVSRITKGDIPYLTADSYARQFNMLGYKARTRQGKTGYHVEVTDKGEREARLDNVLILITELEAREFYNKIMPGPFEYPYIGSKYSWGRFVDDLCYFGHKSLCVMIAKEAGVNLEANCEDPHRPEFSVVNIPVHLCHLIEDYSRYGIGIILIGQKLSGRQDGTTIYLQSKDSSEIRFNTIDDAKEFIKMGNFEFQAKDGESNYLETILFPDSFTETTHTVSGWISIIQDLYGNAYDHLASKIITSLVGQGWQSTITLTLNKSDTDTIDRVFDQLRKKRGKQ